MPTPKRPSGDKTRTQILKAALSLFSKQGFAGTSISQIAKRADINQSLIYHHFESKEKLWQETKLHIIPTTLDTFQKEFSNPKLSGAEFIQGYCRTRIEMAEKKPEFQKMMLWQSLENNRDVLMYSSRYNMSDLLKLVEKLQQKKALRSDWSAPVILTLLSASVMGLLILMPTIKDPTIWRQCVNNSEEMLLNTLLRSQRED